MIKVYENEKCIRQLYSKSVKNTYLVLCAKDKKMDINGNTKYTLEFYCSDSKSFNFSFMGYTKVFQCDPPTILNNLNIVINKYNKKFNFNLEEVSRWGEF